MGGHSDRTLSTVSGMAKNILSQWARRARHLVSARKSATEDLISTIKIAASLANAKMSARRPQRQFGDGANEAPLVLRDAAFNGSSGRGVPSLAHRQCAPLATFASFFSAALSASVRAAETGHSGLRIASTRPAAFASVASMR
jgi:hypothetical protein